MQRSSSVPLDFDTLELANLQNDVNILQDKFQKENEQNIKHSDTIRILQNQIDEKNRTINTLLNQVQQPTFSERLQKATKPKAIKKTNKETFDRQQFYKKNKNSEQVANIALEIYRNIFEKQAIPIPWQLIRAITDKLYDDHQASKKKAAVSAE